MSKKLEKNDESGIIESGFEADILRQSTKSIEKGIKSLCKKIVAHEEKIANPESVCPDWESMMESGKAGTIRHWKKEISNFKTSIAS